MPPRYCLITCFMGPLPDYYPYFVATCKRNPGVHFVVISDQVPASGEEENLRFIRMNLDELNAFASARLNRPIQLANSWKINELKPLFGVLFADLLEPYEFWGWCDLDIIWGCLDHFITPALLENYDVVTSKRHWTTGHFTLFRNTPELNRLYERNEDVYDLLNRRQYLAFEECCHRWEGEFHTLAELRASGMPISMYDIVKNAEKEGRLRASFEDRVREYPAVPIHYHYRNGTFTDLNTGEEFMYYHLLAVKKLWRFYIPFYKKIPEGLYISGKGIRSLSESPAWWAIRRARSCYSGMMRSFRKQGLRQILAKLKRRAFNGAAVDPIV